MAKDQATEVSVIEDMEVTPALMTELFGPAEPIEGVELQLAPITIAHQNQAFQIDDEMTKTFDGQILDIINVNAWWSESFDETGGGTPPECFSMDGIKPSPGCENQQHPVCRSCPQNQFGSDGARGKSCKNMKRVHVMLKGDMLPCRLTVPPTSIRPVNEYVSSLYRRVVLPPWFVVTKFSLKEAKNRGGIKYSELVLEMKEILVDFSKGKDVAKEQGSLIMKQREDMLPIMRGIPIDYEEAHEGGDAPF